MNSFGLHTFFGQRALTNVGEKRSELRLYVGLLLAASGFFILLHLGHGLTTGLGLDIAHLANPKLLLTYPGGFGEVFVFSQLLILTGILARTGLWTKQPIFLFWAVVYFFVLLDDSFNIHGYLGGLLAPSLPVSGWPGMTQQHTGELVSWMAIGCAAVAGLIQANSHSMASYREISQPLCWTFALLLFFAVGVDTVHQTLDGLTYLQDSLLGLFEEGGEMVAVTLTIGAAIVVSRKAALVLQPDVDRPG